MKQKTDTISMLKFFQNLHKTEILGAGSPISHPSSEDPNGAPDTVVIVVEFLSGVGKIQ